MKIKYLKTWKKKKHILNCSLESWFFWLSGRMPLQSFQPNWHHPVSELSKQSNRAQARFSIGIHTTQSSFLFNSEARPFWLFTFDCEFYRTTSILNLVFALLRQEFYWPRAFDLLFHSCLCSLPPCLKIYSSSRSLPLKGWWLMYEVWDMLRRRDCQWLSFSKTDTEAFFLLFYDVWQMFLDPSAWVVCDVVYTLRSLRNSSYVMESMDWSCYTVPLELRTLVVD